MQREEKKPPKKNTLRLMKETTTAWLANDSAVSTLNLQAQSNFHWSAFYFH